MSADWKRQVDRKYAKREEDQTGFADGFPVLLISEESLDDLNSRLEKKLPMNRFRPNIVVTGAGAFSEDDWSIVRIGEVTFDVVKPCARCVITTVDQSTSETSSEPLRALSKFRHFNNRILFGQNLVHHLPGKIRVGDTVIESSLC